MTTIGFESHNHKHCIANGVKVADVVCRKAGLRLTPTRRRVLKLLLEEHRAMGAYEVLDVLREEGLGSQPPVAYRALEFLMQHGFAHRIEHLNAFIACAYPGQDHTPAFLICQNCTSIAEAPLDASKGRLGKAAKTAGFTIEKVVVESIGLCPACSGTEV